MPGRLIKVGQIVGAFGIKGQVKVMPMTDFVDDRFDFDASLFLKDHPIILESIGEQKSHLVLKIEGIDTRNQAEELQWEYIYAPEDERPDLDEDEYLTEDLIGLEVYTVSGERLGNVSEVLFYPANDLLVVGEKLIPVVRQFVKEINIEEKRITVELLDGM